VNNDIKLDFVGQLTGLAELRPTRSDTIAKPTPIAVPKFVLSPYFTFRRFADPFAALVLIILLSPIMVITALLVLMDIGTPVMFWQQRIGRKGRAFLLYKFRTLKAPYDWRGHPILDRNELSFIGRLLRQRRCDEFPQLFNVLVGDMALIGPRPLLPEDQPTNPTMRLIARPGITGWAQVNGGKFLTPEQKDQYDEFYIRNASVWFDLHILYMTLKVFSG
jgi:lipopolysaccharide/colanic/teichoic acid biosynthesis glycosyltransferase